MGRLFDSGQLVRLRSVYRRVREWGFDPLLLLTALLGYAKVQSDFRNLRRQSMLSPNALHFKFGERYSIFKDKADSAGTARGHYFWQDLLVAQDIHRKNPSRHIDVGSSIAGFVAHVASFREIEVIDIRPLANNVPGITFTQADITQLGERFEAIADSVSCLHTLEHIGLGRYGDRVDFDGWIQGFEKICMLLVPGGTLYLSVPTGAVQRIEFNAHRVFSLPFLADFIKQRMLIDRVDFLDDNDELHRNIDLESPEAQTSFGAHYGLSIWVLSKPLPLSK
jgi:hypothetical protein